MNDAANLSLRAVRPQKPFRVGWTTLFVGSAPRYMRNKYLSFLLLCPDVPVRHVRLAVLNVCCLFPARQPSAVIDFYAFSHCYFSDNH